MAIAAATLMLSPPPLLPEVLAVALLSVPEPEAPLAAARSLPAARLLSPFCCVFFPLLSLLSLCAPLALAFARELFWPTELAVSVTAPPAAISRSAVARTVSLT